MASRAPEIKRNLQVQNGTFGVLVSLGALGALGAFIFVGQLVHRIGVGPVLSATSIIIFGFNASIPHLHSIWIYTLMTILIGFGFNAHFIALHDQAIKRQKLSGRKLIPSLHGSFSLGCLLTAVLSLVLTPHISLAWHVDTLMVILWIGTTFSLFQMRPFLIRGLKSEKKEFLFNNTKVWSMLTRDQYVVIAYVCAVMVEFSTNDWVTLLSHQENGASSSLSVVPFLIFVVGMVTGRLGFHKLPASKSETFWISTFSRVGGLGFIGFLLMSKLLSHRNFAAAFACEILAFFIGGLGGSFLAGVLTQIATDRSELPAGVVVAQLSFALTIITFLLRILIAGVIQATSITYGLLIPGVLMITLSFFTKLGSQQKSSIDSKLVT